MAVFKEAETYLQQKREKLMQEWGLDPVPDEPTPESKGRGAERAFSVRNYGLNTWGDLFNARQKLALITFVEKVRKVHEKMRAEGCEKEYATAVVSYLAFINSKLTDKTSSLSRWLPTSKQVVATFSRQALPMVWDYGEFNPLTNDFVEWGSNTISKELKLVILRKENKALINDILKSKRQTPRVYRNTLFFLYTLEVERVGFLNTIKRKIAFENIAQDKNLKLTDEQKKEV